MAVDAVVEGGGDAVDGDRAVVESPVEHGCGVAAAAGDVLEVLGEEREAGVAGEVAAEVRELWPPGGDVGHAGVGELVVEPALPALAGGGGGGLSGAPQVVLGDLVGGSPEGQVGGELVGEVDAGLPRGGLFGRSMPKVLGELVDLLGAGVEVGAPGWVVSEL